MIKSGFFVVDTVHRGKKLLFAYPDQMPEDIFSSTDEPSQKYDNSQNMQEIFMANFFKNMNFCIIFLQFLILNNIKYDSWKNIYKKYIWI